MTHTTLPTRRSGLTRKTQILDAANVRNLSLRTASFFVNLPPADHPNYVHLTYRTLLEKGRLAIEAAHNSIPPWVQLATVRLIPPLLDQRILMARSRAEAAAIAHEEFLLREDAATELNLYAARIFGPIANTQVFFGAYGVSAHSLADFAFEGFMDAAVRNLPSSRWQFGLAALGDAPLGIHDRALDLTSEAIAALCSGGARFAAMFGMADHTPFCPCAHQAGSTEGIAVGMSSPAALRCALRSRKAGEPAAEAIRRTQCDALHHATAVGRQMATNLNTRFFGCDPSQAPVFDVESPGANSIGAVIEEFSGVPLGAPGTKDGFFRLMAALRQAGADSGVPLCGFLNGSFLPVAEDDVVAAAVASGTLTYSGILSLCHVCAAGIDMAVLEPGTTAATIAHVLRDVAATHLLKGKALAARLIVPQRGTPTDENGYYVFGGLLGRAPVLPLEPESRRHRS